MERVVINAVGEARTVEDVLAGIDRAVLGVGVVVLGIIHLIAPAVMDEQTVVAVAIRIFRIDICVQILNSEHVIDAIAIRGDHVREDKILLDNHRMRDFA